MQLVLKYGFCNEFFCRVCDKYVTTNRFFTFDYNRPFCNTMIFMCLKVNGILKKKSKPKMPPSTNLPFNKWRYFKGLL